MPDNNYIHSFKSDNQRLITDAYNKYKAPFLSFAHNQYGMNRDDAEDVYVDSFMAVYQNIQNDKLTDLTVSFKTYLFTVGKNKIIDSFRKPKNEVVLERFSDIFSGNDNDFNEIYPETPSADEQRQMIVYEAVSRMETPCAKILHLFYYEKKSMNDIAELMHYTGSDVAKSQKLRCMKRIAVIIKEKLTQAELM